MRDTKSVSKADPIKILKTRRVQHLTLQKLVSHSSKKSATFYETAMLGYKRWSLQGNPASFRFYGEPLITHGESSAPAQLQVVSFVTLDYSSLILSSLSRNIFSQSSQRSKRSNSTLSIASCYTMRVPILSSFYTEPTQV